MAYDFTSLSAADFEDLCRDLIGRKLSLQFEAFAPGPDGGMDGRHARAGSETVLQVKHYAGSTFSKLKAAMKGERKSIDGLAPQRYILATSRQLTPANKTALASEIGAALQAPGDIYGPGDLNALLREFPDIEKAHIKLWLQSTAVLERVLASAAHTVTAMTKADVEAKVRIYAQNPSFSEAQAILESQHVLIVSGPPGVGKTTLAEMLSYAYLAEGWELVAIRSLDDGFGSIDDSKKQVFFFDDFLGKIALDVKALAAKDSDLARFMRLVRNSPNARFILTTRAYIFEEARQASENLADERLDISRYLLDVGIYTRRIRARILYNHLVFAGTPVAHMRSLIESGTAKRVVDHPNYNPRVIEWMTAGDRLHDVTPSDYPKAFLAALANPKRLWDTAFRKHIPEKCRHLLLTMYFCSQYGVALEALRNAFEPLHQELCASYGIPRDPKDFEEAIRILEGGFIRLEEDIFDLGGIQAQYVNPSFRDYMADYVHDVELLSICAGAGQTAQWADAVWDVVVAKVFSPDQRKRLANAFADIASRFIELPSWKETAPNTYAPVDISNTKRIQLLLAWWGESGEDRFAELALAFSRAPPAPRHWSGFDSWRDGTELVELVSRIRREDYYPDLPVAEALIDVLEGATLRLLDGDLPYDELENIADAIEDCRPAASDALQEAAREAIRRAVDDIGLGLDHVDSESMLEDQVRSLEKLAPRASVPQETLAAAIAKVRQRIEEIEEEASVADAPSIPATKPEREVFTDAALNSLFGSLLQEA